MDGFERYVGMLKGEEIDYLPRIPIVMQFAAEYIGSNYGEFASDYRVLVDANHRCAEDFGFDQLSAISDPYRETQGFGGQVTYVRDGVPHCTNPLESTKDLSVLLHPNPYVSKRMVDRLKAVGEYKRLHGRKYSIMGWVEGPGAEAADLRGAMNFLMDTIEDPEFLSSLMDICVEVGIDFARAQVDAGADTIGIGDAIASQLSAEFYGSHILPRERQLVKGIHEAGAYARLHICGNITHLLRQIADLEVDILDVDHMVNVADVRKIVRDKVVIGGNIDPVTGILRGTPASIRKFVENTYKAAGDPFMVSAGCEIPSKTPIENLEAFCKPIPRTKVED